MQNTCTIHTRATGLWWHLHRHLWSPRMFWAVFRGFLEAFEERGGASNSASASTDRRQKGPGVSKVTGTPLLLAGWFISWKITTQKRMMAGGTPVLGNPIYSGHISSIHREWPGLVFPWSHLRASGTCKAVVGASAAARLLRTSRKSKVQKVGRLREFVTSGFWTTWQGLTNVHKLRPVTLHWYTLIIFGSHSVKGFLIQLSHFVKGALSLSQGGPKWRFHEDSYKIAR